MPETVDIPKVGPVKKVYLYAGVAAAAGVVGYAYWRNAQTAADAAPITPAEADTGLEPGGSAGGQGNGFGGSAGGSDTTIDVPATNADWYEKAYEATSLVYDPKTAAAALGKYLAHQGLTPTEITIVQVGLAAAGPPPTGGPYVFVPATTPTPSGPPPSTAPKVYAPLLVHVIAGTTTRTEVQIGWNAQHAAVGGFYVYRNGARIVRHQGTYHHDRGLKPNTYYKYQVTAIGSDGKESPKSAIVTAHTKK